MNHCTGPMTEPGTSTENGTDCPAEAQADVGVTSRLAFTMPVMRRSPGAYASCSVSTMSLLPNSRFARANTENGARSTVNACCSGATSLPASLAPTLSSSSAVPKMSSSTCMNGEVAGRL